MRIASCLSLLVGVLILGYAEQASAGVNVSALAGYGMPGQPAGDDLMRFGVGARLGYTLPIIPLYFGASSTFHMGSKDDLPGAQNNYLNYHALEFGAELGLAGVGIRPYLMAGIADVNTDRDADGGFLSPAFGAGLAPYYNIIDTAIFDLFIGLDARFIYLTTQIDGPDGSQQITKFPVYLEVGGRLF